jgi:hypothetical protein
LEPRLQRRYRPLVLEHLHVSDPLAAGIHALAGLELADGFAAVLEVLEEHSLEEFRRYKDLLRGGAEEDAG